MVWVVAKCGFGTWTCFALLRTMTLQRHDTFWVTISNSICVLLMMPQFELRHCNSCLHENAIVWKLIWIQLRSQNVSFIISVSPTLSDSRQVAAFVVFVHFRVDPFEIRHPPHPTLQRGNTFLTEFSLIPEDYSCGCYSVIPTLNLTLLCQPSITRLQVEVKFIYG